MSIHVQLYRESDAEALAQVFFDSVRNGTKEFYSAEQRAAWACEVPDVASWADRLGGVTTFVAQNDDVILGFMTLDSTGYIDLAFVKSDYIRQGIGSMLYGYIQREAVLRNMPLLHAQASEMAKHFFLKHGWKLIKTQFITRKNKGLVNHLMEKYL